MPVVYQVSSMSMSWCLDCHRAPEEHLRDPALVTEMGYLDEVRSTATPTAPSSSATSSESPLKASARRKTAPRATTEPDPHPLRPGAPAGHVRRRPLHPPTLMIELDVLSKADVAADGQPKHWRSLAQRDGAPGLAALAGHEFHPAADIDAEPSGSDRRTFIKVMGASMALAGVGLAGCRRPVEKVLPYVRPGGHHPRRRELLRHRDAARRRRPPAPRREPRGPARPRSRATRSTPSPAARAACSRRRASSTSTTPTAPASSAARGWPCPSASSSRSPASSREPRDPAGGPRRAHELADRRPPPRRPPRPVPQPAGSPTARPPTSPPRAARSTGSPRPRRSSPSTRTSSTTR
jgi:MoCo/4Fe-4S cofactor protein with predicted Tat translocation signal